RRRRRARPRPSPPALPAAEVDDVATATAAAAVGLDREPGGGEAPLEGGVALLGPDREHAAGSEGGARARQGGGAVERIVGDLGRGVRPLVEVEDDRVEAARGRGGD